MEARSVETSVPEAERTPAGESSEAVGSRYVCPFCGSQDAEAMAWVRMNDDSISSYDETPDYWCPDCNEHRRGICYVSPAGRCTLHDQPFTECQAQARANEKGEPL